MGEDELVEAVSKKQKAVATNSTTQGLLRVEETSYGAVMSVVMA